MSDGIGRAVWVAALVSLLLMVGLLAGPGRSHEHTHTSDTNNLVAGARVARACIGDGTWSRCGYRPELSSSKVGAYPLLQYIPTFGMQALGFDDHATLRGLVDLNLLALVGVVALTFLLAPGPRRLWLPLLLAVVLSGPLLVYSRSAFGELLVAWVALAAVAAATRRRPIVCAALVVLACLGKETFAPFVVVLCVLSARDDDDGWLPRAPMTAAIGLGAVLGVTVNGLFNIFRFGTVGNRTYLRDAYQVTSPSRVARNVGNLVAAPGGGVLVFWPLLAILLLIALVSAVRLAIRHRWRLALPSLVALACGAAWSISLASWWAPFGGMAWGPRLALPILPALVVVVARVGGEPLSRAVASVLRPRWSFAVVAVVVLIASWPQLSAPWHQVGSIGRLLRSDAACPNLTSVFTSAGIFNSAETYWRCFDHTAWRLTHTPIRSASKAPGTAVWVARAIGLAGVAACLVAARRGVRWYDAREPTRSATVPLRTSRHGRREVSLTDAPRPAR